MSFRSPRRSLAETIQAAVLSKQQPLREGLIKVPPSMMATVMREVAETILWMLRDKCSNTTHPKHRAAVLAEAKRLGVKLPRNKFAAPSAGWIMRKVTLDVSELPANYQHLTPVTPELIVGLDVTGKLDRLAGPDALAFFWPRKSKATGELEPVLVCYLLRSRGVTEFPSRRSPEEVPFIVRALRDSIEHELRHAVQAMLLEPVDANQTKMLPDYKQHGTDYFASPIERDPHLGSAVSDFIDAWHIVAAPERQGYRRPKLSDTIKMYVGAKKAPMFDPFGCAPIFKALRKTDPVAWKRAVAKFVVELRAKLDPLIASGEVLGDASPTQKPSARQTPAMAAEAALGPRLASDERIIAANEGRLPSGANRLDEQPTIAPIIDNPNPSLGRCTTVTCNSMLAHFHKGQIGAAEMPRTARDCMNVLNKRGLGYRPETFNPPVTVKTFAERHPRGTWFIGTPNHAMSLIDGELFDTARQGLDGRMVELAAQVAPQGQLGPTY